MQKYQDVVSKPNGDIVVGASVLVQTYPAGVTSTIYSDDGVTAATNPLTTDSLGGFAFYAPNGRYQLVISGAGITQRTVTDVLLEDITDVYVSNFGVLGLGNDAAIMQAAIDSVVGTSARLIIPGNTTVQLGSTGLTVNGSLNLIGEAGRNRTAISWTNTTMTAITVASNAAVYFDGINFAGPSSCTAGGAISLSGAGAGTANSFSKIVDCQFTNGYRQVYAPDAYAWQISGNYFNAPVNTGVYVGNTTAADAGDSSLLDNVFANGIAGSVYVRQVSSGGLRVLDNKLNGGAYGYLGDLGAGVTTSILIFEGNSVENQTVSGVCMRNTAGTASFSQVIVDGNQFYNQPTPILFDDAMAFMSTMAITDNTIVCKTGAGTTCAITVTAVPKTVISGNVIFGSGTTALGINVGASSTDSKVTDDNVVYGCTTDATIANTNTVASAATISLPAAYDIIQISGVTGITGIATGNAWKGRTVTLMFQGVLTVTDGSNLKLAGNFTTTADDTLTLACVDGTNWYEVCRSVN